MLNFKGIPYTQSWISYPDIKPLGISLGLEPNKDGREYTLPMIIHKSTVGSNSNGALMDSLAIALHIDEVFPSPPLFPNGQESDGVLVTVQNIMREIERGIRPLIVPRVMNHLDPRGQAYFHETRSKALGKPLSEVRPTDTESLDALWNIIEGGSLKMIALLKEKEGKKGPFFESGTAGYMDLIYAAQLAFIERFDKELFEKCMGLGNGEIREFYTACLPWIEGQGQDVDLPIQQPA